ncbi:BlaI/MecI/CopY family transcriptional regulator [Streptomyces mirabilis]|uniref:BlaI/MecI/CopY family transcriptional regulator n=1 Tax=Streptomyces mirabilis TaxID=68239 RepID=UPI0007C68C7F|nr:BlaI/MecI/CopY family transcriptional regulator [Streptomyces mirabilis]
MDASAKPTLVEVIRGHLEQQGEPRSAAEITAALTQAHPDRSVKTTVVRTTLEGLVAKSHAHRTKQGSSVFYTAAAASQPAPAEPQQEASDVGDSCGFSACHYPAAVRDAPAGT